MRTAIVLCTIVLAVVAAALSGCESKAERGKPSRTAGEESNDVDTVIDQALARGADIPRSKRNLVVRMLCLNEKDLILGLRTFADLSGGRYPRSLDTQSTLRQIETDQLGSSMPELSESWKEQMVQDIFFACAFSEKLRRDGRGIQYYGDTVGRQDAEKLLAWWTESKGRYRVVLGDLTLHSLTTEQLAALQ